MADDVVVVNEAERETRALAVPLESESCVFPVLAPLIDTREVSKESGAADSAVPVLD